MKKMGQNSKNGFTLIELLIVITIIAVLLAIALPNFLGVRQRARDAKRKAELSELKKALQLYYSDYNVYPAVHASNTALFNGCNSDGDAACPLGDGCEFAAGEATCDTATIYMKRLPRINKALNDYGYQYSRPDISNFCLSVPLEITRDSDIGDSHDRCRAFCGSPAGEYVVCND